ncbi:hypothetical protein HAX54_043523 [Datura stramonium]|uniref:Uncharacterized protein n=1 Tax=Datura stramonium TaxID=4076 RepID=A0ABS8SPL5_DATST|nr:hypothetical protein [Datura stramonium]
MAQSSEIIGRSTESESVSVSDAKLLFNNLIALPLKDLINPDNEASMKNVLSTLADNLSVFSEEQAKQIVELKLNFPILVQQWREFSRSQRCSQKFVSDSEKLRDLVDTWVKDGESLKVRCEELESKKNELMAQLDSVGKEKAHIAEQINKKFKQI